MVNLNIGSPVSYTPTFSFVYVCECEYTGDMGRLGEQVGGVAGGMEKGQQDRVKPSEKGGRIYLIRIT